MKIFEDYDLTELNTFGVSAKAKYFVQLEKESDLEELLSSSFFAENNRMFLGGGSNVLFTKDYPGIIVLNKLKGITVSEHNEGEVLVRSMSGEGWNDLVDFSVKRGYWGIENLAMIPGTVGGSPVQNIGAYGVDLAETLETVEVFDTETGERKVLSKTECELGYRDSVFKNKSKGKYFIIAVTLRLKKISQPNVEYRVLKEYIEKNNIIINGPEDVSRAVSEIRKSKLPDPKLVGNAGSFFKNVFVDSKKLEELMANYPDIPYFEEDGVIKIPSGWLIEHSGPSDSVSWKGYRSGSVGVHDKQALVLVNHGGATGEEIKEFSGKIIDSIRQKFGLVLTPEVNLI